ncbi:MAG: RNA-binding protein [bacterium]
MAIKLFVGSLSWGTTDESLREYFAQAGEVASAIVIKDKMTGRSKGFGFVEFADDAAGKQAIDMFNGKELDGRTITVNEARPMEARPPRRDFDRGGDRAPRTSSW